MHGAILAAARSGVIEHLREVLEQNELMPLVNGRFVHDPVEYWKAGSKDNAGFHILAQLTEILELPPVKKTTKHGVLYIWPYLAGVPLNKLRPTQIVQLYRLASAKKSAQMQTENRYSHVIVTIGSDGTWHSFENSDD